MWGPRGPSRARGRPLGAPLRSTLRPGVVPQAWAATGACLEGPGSGLGARAGGGWACCPGLARGSTRIWGRGQGRRCCRRGLGRRRRTGATRVARRRGRLAAGEACRGRRTCLGAACGGCRSWATWRAVRRSGWGRGARPWGAMWGRAAWAGGSCCALRPTARWGTWRTARTQVGGGGRGVCRQGRAIESKPYAHLSCPALATVGTGSLRSDVDVLLCPLQSPCLLPWFRHTQCIVQ